MVGRATAPPQASATVEISVVFDRPMGTSVLDIAQIDGPKPRVNALKSAAPRVNVGEAPLKHGEGKADSPLKRCAQDGVGLYVRVSLGGFRGTEGWGDRTEHSPKSQSESLGSDES